MSRSRGFLPFNYHVDVMFAIDSFESYVKLVEDNFEKELRSLEEMQEEIQKDIVANGQNYSDEYISHLEDYTYEDYRRIEDEFIFRFRNSIIIQLFSYLESKLVEICNSHSETFNKEYTLKDLKGSNEIDKIKTYLKNSAKIDLSLLGSNWLFINDLRKVRNKIVHLDSVVEKKDGDFNSILKFSVDNFKFEKRSHHSETYAIVLDNKGFILTSIKTIENFLNAILNDNNLYS